MTLKQNKIITANELSQKLNIPKSTIHYYAHLGLIKPMVVIGKIMAFDEQKTIKNLKFIRELKKKKILLKEIAKKINT